MCVLLDKIYRIFQDLPDALGSYLSFSLILQNPVNPVRKGLRLVRDGAN
jgi:hypothetical protein